MKIFSWNVNGIRAVLKKGEIQNLLETENPDIICLQEIKAEKSLVDIDFAGYEEFWNPAEKKGYSGTAIFSKIKPISVFLNLPEKYEKKYNIKDNFGDTNREGRVITLEYKDFYLCTVYTPNSKRDLERLSLRHENWDKAFLEYICELEKNKPVIFCGDLNVAHTENDLARPKENVGNAGFTDEERKSFTKILEKGFVDTFRIFTEGNGNYTWWSNLGGGRIKNIGWRIDYFMVSESLKNKVKTAEIHSKVMGSDHCPVSIQIDFK